MVINKNSSKIYKVFWLVFAEIVFVGPDLVEVLFVETVLVSSFLKCNHWITNNTSWIFTVFTSTCRRIPNIILFAHMMFFGIFRSHRHLSLFCFWFELHFLPVKLQIYIRITHVLLIFLSYLFLKPYKKHIYLTPIWVNFLGICFTVEGKEVKLPLSKTCQDYAKKLKFGTHTHT